jgi:HSP20 family protein
VYGKVLRSFTLPQEVDESKAQAKFENGVLELTLPKKAAAQRKQISIQ